MIKTTNPVTKWELQDFSIEFDIGKLMENFFNLRSHATYEVVHTHHIQVVTFDIPDLAGGTEGSATGLTWPEAFPAGITPVVWAHAQTTGALGTNQTHFIFTAFNVSNTGCDIRIYNSRLADAAGGALNGYGRAVAFDSTYNVSLA